VGGRVTDYLRYQGQLFEVDQLHGRRQERNALGDLLGHVLVVEKWAIFGKWFTER
jgi:hypothetical protein